MSPAAIQRLRIVLGRALSRLDGGGNPTWAEHTQPRSELYQRQLLDAPSEPWSPTQENGHSPPPPEFLIHFCRAPCLEGNDLVATLTTHQRHSEGGAGGLRY
jgi:hypothetical protein